MVVLCHPMSLIEHFSRVYHQTRDGPTSFGVVDEGRVCQLVQLFGVYLGTRETAEPVKAR